MKRLFISTATIIVSLCLFVFSYGQKTNNKVISANTVGKGISDTSKYAIIKFYPSYTWIFKKVTPTILTKEDIQGIEIVLQNCIDNYNPGQKQQFDSLSKIHPEYNLKVQDFVIDLSKYKRQYFAVTNESGETEVWVNCFCDVWKMDWRNQLLIVNDGGNCYFNLIINLTKKIYHHLSVNGDA